MTRKDSQEWLEAEREALDAPEPKPLDEASFDDLDGQPYSTKSKPIPRPDVDPRRFSSGREAAEWLNANELAEAFGKKARTTFDGKSTAQGTEYYVLPGFEPGGRRFDTWIERRRRSTDDT